MNAEKFRETFIRQYRDEIQEILIESTHRPGIDWKEFNHRLAHTWEAAKVDGLAPYEFEQILSEVCRDHLSHIDFAPTPYKQAA